MSIRQGILAMLADGPRHGYQLRADFEERTGSTWPLNIGQVYTTLSRLERDQLVIALDAAADDTQKRYALTDQGRAELASWFATPVHREDRPRDELAIKLAMAAELPGTDLHAVVQAQRTDTMRALQDYTRLRRNHEEDSGEISWPIVLDSLIFSTEAEIRWLDACEERLSRRPTRPARKRGARAVDRDDPADHDPADHSSANHNDAARHDDEGAVR
jgi:DNA-binding PadR family transcriptional regulator